jgi:hypothetical protein
VDGLDAGDGVAKLGFDPFPECHRVDSFGRSEQHAELGVNGSVNPRKTAERGNPWCLECRQPLSRGLDPPRLGAIGADADGAQLGQGLAPTSPFRLVEFDGGPSVRP